MEKQIIMVKNLTKSFKNKILLDNITCNIEEGKITGIIGKNGAGKTLLIKAIIGFIIPDSGEIIYNKDESTNNMKPEIGILIENPGYLKDFSGYDNLIFLSKINGKINSDRINEVLKLVGLYDDRNKKVEKYSMGMKQRLAIAQAIMEDQKIIFLDEPFNSLDREFVEVIRNFLFKLKSENKTIILTSHYREDIDILCDNIIELEEGHIIYN